MATNAPVASVKSVPGEVNRIVFEEEEIIARVGELAEQISRDYLGKDLVVVGILKGASVFTCDLVRALNIPVKLDFVAISNYSPKPQSGVVRILKDLQEDVDGRHVLLVEDIVDTGLTLNYLVRVVNSRAPASLSVCTLLDRPGLRLADLPIRYSGFHVNQQFLIGYGLDYRESFRDLPYIATMRIK